MAIYVAFWWLNCKFWVRLTSYLVWPINLIVNAGQNKFEVDFLKNVAKIANLKPKIGQIPLLSLDIIGHNSIIFI